MSREIYCEIRDSSNKEIWNSADDDLFVCGRDDVTDHLSGLADDDCDIDITSTEEFDKVHSFLSDQRECEMKQASIFMRRLEDACMARRNARNAEEFRSFDSLIDEAQYEMEEHRDSTAKLLLEIIDRGKVLLSKHRLSGSCSLFIVVSE